MTKMTREQIDQQLENIKAHIRELKKEKNKEGLKKFLGASCKERVCGICPDCGRTNAEVLKCLCGNKNFNPFDIEEEK